MLERVGGCFRHSDVGLCRNAVEFGLLSRGILGAVIRVLQAQINGQPQTGI